MLNKSHERMKKGTQEEGVNHEERENCDRGKRTEDRKENKDSGECRVTSDERKRNQNEHREKRNFNREGEVV